MRRKSLRRVGQTPFVRKVLVLSSGASVAQVIPLALSPILTRLYSPREFGILALYIACTTALGLVATARYELAIVLPEDARDASALARLSLTVTTVVALFASAVSALLHNQIASFLGAPDLAPWLLLTPLSIFFAGAFSTLTYLNTRLQNYGALAGAPIVKATVTGVAQVSGGAAGAGAAGLILGHFMAAFAANTRLARSSLRFIRENPATWADVRRCAREYADFPRFSTPAAAATAIAQEAPIFLTSSLYGAGPLGHYSLVQRTLVIPTALVGQAVAQVYLQEATEIERSGRSSHALFRATAWKLALLGIPVFGALIVTAPSLYVLVFGESWREAGNAARYLAPFFFAKFVVSGLTPLLIVRRKQRAALAWQISLLAVTLLSAAIAHMTSSSFFGFLTLLTVSSCIHYLALWVYLDRVASKTPTVNV